MIEATFTAKVVSLSLTQSAGERSNCSSSTPTRMGQRYCPDLSDCWSYPPGSAGGIGCVRHTPYPRLRRRYLPPCFAWGTDPPPTPAFGGGTFPHASHGGLILGQRRYLPPLPAVVGDSSHLSTLCRGGLILAQDFSPGFAGGAPPWAARRSDLRS